MQMFRLAFFSYALLYSLVSLYGNFRIRKQPFLNVSFNPVTAKGVQNYSKAFDASKFSSFDNISNKILQVFITEV